MNKQFNINMLLIARQSRRMSQTELAKRTNIPQGTLSKIEGGLMPPSEEMLSVLANILEYKPGFFFQQGYLQGLPVTFHRKKQSLSAKDRDTIHARAEIFRCHLRKLFHSVDIEPALAPIPAIKLEEYGGDIEAVALSLRQYWTIPRGTIADLTRLIEDTGAVIIPFDFGTRLIDGFSQHPNGNLPSIIFVNTGQSKDRLRFTLAHELGHLVLHHLPCQEMEAQADRFAGAFLMPKDDIIAHFQGMSLQRLMSLKLHWKVSMAALLHRARDLEKLNDSTFRYYIMQMKQKGYWGHEPVDITEEIEKPKTVKQLIEVHVKQLSYSIEELSNLFEMNLQEVKDLYFQENRPHLRVIYSTNKPTSKIREIYRQKHI